VLAATASTDWPFVAPLQPKCAVRRPPPPPWCEHGLNSPLAPLEPKLSFFAACVWTDPPGGAQQQNWQAKQTQKSGKHPIGNSHWCTGWGGGRRPPIRAPAFEFTFEPVGPHRSAHSGGERACGWAGSTCLASRGLSTPARWHWAWHIRGITALAIAFVAVGALNPPWAGWVEKKTGPWCFPPGACPMPPNRS